MSDTKKFSYLRNSYDDPKWSFAVALFALLLAYGMGSRALDTGSWQQYFLTFALLIWSFNRFGHTAIYLIRGRAKKA